MNDIHQQVTILFEKENYDLMFFIRKYTLAAKLNWGIYVLRNEIKDNSRLICG